MKNILFSLLLIGLTYSKSSIYFDVMMTNSLDLELSWSNPTSALSLSGQDEMDGTCLSFGYEYDFFNKEENSLILSLGFSYSIVPIEKKNIPFLAGSNLISHLDNKFPIISSYFKVSLPVDNNLDVWTSIGISKIDSKEDYYVYVTSNDTYIPIKEILFDTGFIYGVGIDYKMKNGFFAGFNFIYDNYDFNSKVEPSINTYYSASGSIDLLRRSIRLGYSF
tara:strand:+ start:133 stop:795 length:663 start_codon:yes stop_codon:yes gene_type:complete